MEQVPPGYDEDAIAPLLNGARAVIRSSLSTRTHVQYQSGARQLVAFLRKYAPTRILPLEEIDYILFTIFLLDEQELAPSSILQYYVHLNYFFICNTFKSLAEVKKEYYPSPSICKVNLSIYTNKRVFIISCLSKNDIKN